MSGTQRLSDTLRRPEAPVVAACAVLGVAVAIIGGLSGITLVALVVLPLLALAAFLVFGLTGSLLTACAVSSFLLMNRIDEGVVIPIGSTALKASYWIVMLSAAALAVVDTYVLLSDARVSNAARKFTRIYLVLFSCFAGILVVGGVLNHLYDRTIFVREANGEFLACLSILSPMLFVPLILHAPLTRRQLVITVQAFIALGALAGLTLAAFGFLPARLLDVLGWASANQGTVGLLRGRMPLGHPNSVAAVIILLLPPAVVLGLIPGSHRLRMAYLLGAVFMFGGVLFSLARSALIVTTLILAMTVAYIYFGRGRKTLMTYLLPAFFSIALVAVMAYLFTSFDFSRFWSTGYYEEATIERRNVSLTTSIAVFKDHPLWGITPDAFYTRLELRPGWTPPMEDNISPIYYYQSQMSAETPHNMYMTVLAETGVLGALFFFGTIAWILTTLWRLRKSPGLSDEQRHALMGFMIGLCGFLLMGAFESLLIVGLRPAYLFWAMAGLAVRYAHEIAGQGAREEIASARQEPA